MIGLIILYIIVFITIILLFINIYKPSVFNLNKINQINSNDIGSTEKLDQVINTTNSLVEKVNSLSEIVNNNKVSIASMQAINSSQVSTEDIENIKNQIQTINSTYVDKTKPVGILAGTCSGGVCNTKGNHYRALTYNDKDTKFTSNGLAIPGLSHSKFVPTNKDKAHFTQWFISQEYPKQDAQPVVVPTDPAPYVPPTGVSNTQL